MGDRHGRGEPRGGGPRASRGHPGRKEQGKVLEAHLCPRRQHSVAGELRALKASRAAEKENVGGLLAKRWLRDEELAGASEEILDKNKELQTDVFGFHR